MLKMQANQCFLITTPEQNFSIDWLNNLSPNKLIWDEIRVDPIIQSYADTSWK